MAGVATKARATAVKSSFFMIEFLSLCRGPARLALLAGDCFVAAATVGYQCAVQQLPVDRTTM